MRYLGGGGTPAVPRHSIATMARLVGWSCLLHVCIRLSRPSSCPRYSFPCRYLQLSSASRSIRSNIVMEGVLVKIQQYLWQRVASKSIRHTIPPRTTSRKGRLRLKAMPYSPDDCTHSACTRWNPVPLHSVLLPLRCATSCTYFIARQRACMMHVLVPLLSIITRACRWTRQGTCLQQDTAQMQTLAATSISW